MNNYRNITTSFWTDSKVDDTFTPEDKYFYLYLLTNPHTNICGCYEISTKQMERETGYNSDTCNRLLGRMENTHNVIRYSKTTKEVLLLNWSKYNWTKSEKVAKAVKAVANYIKNQKFKSYVLNLLYNINTETDTVTDADTDTDTDTDTVTDVSIGYRYPIDTLSRKSTPTPTKSKRKAFVPPTIEQVQAYCKEHNKPIDAEAFIGYYGSQGWKKANGQSLSSWELAVCQWYARDKQKGTVYQPNQPNQASYSTREIEERTLSKYKGLK